MIPTQAKAIAALAVAALLFGAGWMVRGWRADAEVSALKADHALEAKRLSDAATEASEKARQIESDWQQSVAELDRQHTKEMQDAKQENERLRAAVDAGAVQLRVRAKCPAAPARDVRGAAAAPGVDDDGTVELDAGARQHYFALRDGIKHDREVILGLQGYVRDVCLAPRQ
ncbi:Rz-like phage lysis protein [Burkholderia phage BcepIL02]|uniref:Spanin, inner membrane subunit n=1 Tax=Burkholderia phage BcepIL02 TaxID=2886898 RepID=C5IHR7_9CAUD|nr:Rz-like spanin [Burkholderia phage BcepIL02]ACR15068.1 Rz-like phage lysis protein [Burkholderia phage BcepIL02]